MDHLFISHKEIVMFFEVKVEGKTYKFNDADVSIEDVKCVYDKFYDHVKVQTPIFFGFGWVLSYLSKHGRNQTLNLNASSNNAIETHGLSETPSAVQQPEEMHKKQNGAKPLMVGRIKDINLFLYIL